MTPYRFVSILENSLLAINFVMLYLSPQTLRGVGRAVYAFWLTSASERRGLPKIHTTSMLKK